MRRSSMPPDPALGGQPEFPSAEITADPWVQSRTLCGQLPGLIAEAEAAGLSIIAGHLTRALALARRVAASGEGRGAREDAGDP